MTLPPLRARILKECYMSLGANTERAANQMLAGLDFALWDAMGKLATRPVHELLGGAHHRRVGYFYFLQGDTPDVAGLGITLNDSLVTSLTTAAA